LKCGNVCVEPEVSDLSTDLNAGCSAAIWPDLCVCVCDVDRLAGVTAEQDRLSQHTQNTHQRKTHQMPSLDDRLVKL